MPIRRLELTAFRNYGHFELVPGEELTVLVGPNATGKTNAMEAIQLVTAARSFRRPKWEELVRWGEDEARVRMTAEDAGTPVEISLEVTAEGKRTYRVNGQAKRRIADVAGIVPSVTFTPEDLELAKGASDRRRAAIDDLGEQLSAAYANVRKDYMRVVRHRNALLREPSAGAGEIEPWDEQLVVLGAKLLVHRTRLFRRLRVHVERSYAELADGERLTLAYLDKLGLGEAAWDEDVPAETAVEAFRVELARRAGEERARLATLVGPHRDDIVFRIDGRDARTYGSQGQQRTIALAWKLAEVQVVEDVARRAPVLLLDDVMSELDARRRKALTDVVRRDVQTFVTTTNLGYFEPSLLETATVVELTR